MPDRRIPHSNNVRWRNVRAQWLPVLFFAMTAVTSGWLWKFHATTIHGVGKVESPRVDLTSPTAGVIVSLPNELRGQWLVYDHVRTGDVIARIQDHELEVNKRLLRQEIEQLVEQFDSLAPDEGMPEDIIQENQNAWQVERAELVRLFEWTLSGDTAMQEGLGNDVEQALLGESESLPLAPSDEAAADDLLASLQSRRLTLTRRWASLMQRSTLLEIQSPITGTLVAVHCWPGQAVPPGGLIATVAADHGQQIIGFVPDQSTMIPEPGMRVSMRIRQIGAKPIESEVEQVGLQIERIPERQRSGSAMPEWGIPVRIRMPADVPLRPGSLVDITFHPSEAG